MILIAKKYIDKSPFNPSDKNNIFFDNAFKYAYNVFFDDAFKYAFNNTADDLRLCYHVFWLDGLTVFAHGNTTEV